MNARLIEVRLAAQADLAGQYEWLAREAGADVAEAMLAAASSAFDKLAEATGLGSPVETAQQELAGLRKWRMPGFNLRIFYIATDQHLFVVRVLHVAQHWPTKFAR